MNRQPEYGSSATAPESAVEPLFGEAHESANRCIRCGYCLPECPTYRSMGREAQSPRGRINLVRAAAEGRIDISGDMASPLDLCLGCRACEAACPVGVPYGRILEAARTASASAAPATGDQKRRRRAERIVLRHLFPHPRRLRLAGNLLWLAQTTGMKSLALRFSPQGIVPPALMALGGAPPPIDSPRRRPAPGAVYPARGKRRARVAFLQGCVMDALLHRINALSIELLREAGCEVIIPRDQVCCGALHAHQGDPSGAAALARRNIAAFNAAGADFFVNNAGGCGAMLRETAHLFEDDPRILPQARAFQEKWRDLAEVLVEFGPLPVRKEFPGVVTYQDSCHLRYVQKAAEAPRILLRMIAGERFREMDAACDCCASGGIYNLLHFRESMSILDQKMKNVAKSGANVVVTSNPGCHVQMALGINRAGMKNKTNARHLAEVLAECVLDRDGGSSES